MSVNKMTHTQVFVNDTLNRICLLALSFELVQLLQICSDWPFHIPDGYITGVGPVRCCNLSTCERGGGGGGWGGKFIGMRLTAGNKKSGDNKIWSGLEIAARLPHFQIIHLLRNFAVSVLFYKCLYTGHMNMSMSTSVICSIVVLLNILESKPFFKGRRC